MIEELKARGIRNPLCTAIYMAALNGYTINAGLMVG
jgi:hypothetical protein